MIVKIKSRRVADILCVATLGVVIVGMSLAVHSLVVVHAQVKFGLSELEASNLKGLKLEKQLQELECSVMKSNYTAETQAFITKTLKDHGNPPNVIFDNGKMEFVVFDPPAAPKPKQDDVK